MNLNFYKILYICNKYCFIIWFQKLREIKNPVVQY